MAATKCAECREEGVLPQAKQRVLLSRSAAVCALGGQVLLQPQQRQLPMLDGPLPATLGVPPIRPLWQPRMTSRCLGLLWLHRLQTLLPAEAASDPSIVRAPVLRDQKACYLRTHQNLCGTKGVTRRHVDGGRDCLQQNRQELEVETTDSIPALQQQLKGSASRSESVHQVARHLPSPCGIQGR